MTDTITSVSTWNIDKAHSAVEFAVKHMMFSTVKGRFTEFTGTIKLDDQNLANSSVSVEIQTDSVDTHDDGRNTHLKSADFFSAEKHPLITFNSTSVEPGKGDEFKVTGDLSINGVTKSVVLNVEQTGRGMSPFGFEVAGFSATTKISRKEFGLEWNAALETGGVLVGDDIKISIEVEANPAVAPEA
ncbi:MAG: YceI family protein [Thermomicrobiales bacterium]